MNIWDLNDSFDKLGSAYIKSYDQINNIALNISGFLIIRHDIILYNGVSLNNKLTQLQSQYDLISISGLLNSILYLNSVDTYFNYRGKGPDYMEEQGSSLIVKPVLD